MRILQQNRMHKPVWRWVVGVTISVGYGIGTVAGDQSLPQQGSFEETIQPFLHTYCLDCHSESDAKGRVVLDRFTTQSHVQEEYELWSSVQKMVRSGRMPPPDAPQPEAEERSRLVAAVDRELLTFDCRKAPEVPFVAARRINRSEYNLTLRDLLGIDWQPAADFPSDDVGYGFDNVADVLSVSPLLLEKYLESAETVVSHVFREPHLKARILVHPADVQGDLAVPHGRNLQEFAERALRRPLTKLEQQNLADLIRSTRRPQDPSQDAVQLTCTAILVSPNFLFRSESADPLIDRDGRRGWLNDWTLASRLSYFLWSSLPDEQLRQLARQDQLHVPEILRRETLRMVQDPKAAAFVENFSGQWLQLRLLDARSPDPQQFPQFNTALRDDMREESIRVFASILSENRQVQEFLSADYSFVNQALADLYGIEGVRGDQFRRVQLPDTRRGIVTHASVLLVTSNPTRTSPVKRGKWVLENILGEPPPPPPPNVPQLKEGGIATGSVRQRMEQHRSNPACAVCHTQMDALGFGLENFSAIGQWRDSEGEYRVDAQGELPGGLQFNGPGELMQVLATHHRESFVRCLTEKLMIYALGRGLQPADRCAVNAIHSELASNGYRFQELITAIVLSEPFLSGPVLP